MMDKCPSCESACIYEEDHLHTFSYGPDGPDHVLLTTSKPIGWSCIECGESFFDHVGEDERAATVERYKRAFKCDSKTFSTSRRKGLLILGRLLKRVS